MKTKVRKHKNKRKSLKRATKKETKKATKRQKKLLNYKNKNTRKNKKGGDAASMALPLGAGILASALIYHGLNKTKKKGPPKKKYRFASWNASWNASRNASRNESQADEYYSFDESFKALLSEHHLVRKLIKPDGDCLFVALLNILENTARSNHDKTIPKTVDELRTDLVDWMGSDKSKKMREGESDEKTFLDQYKDLMLAETNPQNETPIYKDLEHYQKAMKNENKSDNGYAPRSKFGTEFEIMAFVEKYNDVLKDHYKSTNIQLVTLLKKEHPIELRVSSNFNDTSEGTKNLKDLNVELPILFLKDLHYDMITPKT